MTSFFFSLTADYLWRCQMTWTWVYGSGRSFFGSTELVIPSSPSTNNPVNTVPSLRPRLFPHNHPPPTGLPERRQASFVQVLSFSSTILILNISIPISKCQFQNEFISYEEKMYWGKKPSCCCNSKCSQYLLLLSY